MFNCLVYILSWFLISVSIAILIGGDRLDEFFGDDDINNGDNC